MAADFGGPVPSRSPPETATRDLLRFLTCGSVDDGKSTLIGRLLYEAGAVPADVMAQVKRDSARAGHAETDWSLLVDGLEAEREQGITIDVAYRFFSTPRRAFIVADTPGHEQYTRNMATGASTAELAVLLVDARKGLLPQTRRHAAIASLLGVRQAVLAVNKMDLVGWDEAVFRRIETEFSAVAETLSLNVTAVPVSARTGGNLARLAAETPWFDGPTLLSALEDAPSGGTDAAGPFRLPVQYVNRPNLDFRGFAGALASGTVRPGDPVVVAASGPHDHRRARDRTARRRGGGARGRRRHPDAGRRGGRGARRPARRASRPPDSGARFRRARGLDGRRGADSRPLAPAQARGSHPARSRHPRALAARTWRRWRRGPPRRWS